MHDDEDLHPRSSSTEHPRGPLPRPADSEGAALGPCCVCESIVGVRNVIMLHLKAPMPGRGWGCVVCGLPFDGALAVLCDACLAHTESNAPRFRFACRGYPATDGRVPIETLTGAHDHFMLRHPPEDWPS